MPNLYSIPPSVPFADALAEGMLSRYGGGDGLALSRAMVLLPSRRAARNLREAFLRATDGTPTLLPRMIPVGEVDEGELHLTLDAGEELSLPPAISPMRRRLLLANLVRGWYRAKHQASQPMDQAVRLAAELARLIDDVQREQLDFAALKDLAPEEYAAHWQETLTFLGIVTDQWPNILKEHDLLDPVERRNRLLETQARQWKSYPPAYPIIAAGSTGSIPATAALLKVVTRLPQGMLVLPGLDTQMDDACWDALEASHPQFGMKQLLQHIAVARNEVEAWTPPRDAARERLISEVMRPASQTAGWRQMKLDVKGAGLSRVDFSTLHEEAAGIALMMREVLDTPGKTVALVTPDRALARRVVAALLRFGVAADDSAGQPLALTRAGTFLLLLADAADAHFAPVPLLSLLKHPLCAGGYKRIAHLEHTRALERLLLRGVRPASDLSGLKACLASEKHASTELRQWFTRIAALLEEFAAMIGRYDRQGIPAERLLAAHLAAAEALAATDEESGATWLWEKDDGEALSAFMESLQAHAAAMGHIDATYYAGLLRELLGGETYRPKYGLHPRVKILSPMEARMLHADRVVLGGLNEKTWPSEAAGDPWMSRPMRLAFGLPDVTRSIGLSAHDVATLMCAPEVILTRAEKVDGTPTVPSRWLLRLDAVLSVAGAPDALRPEKPWREWAVELDRIAAQESLSPPAPVPPLAARPRTLSATQVETLMRDPYAIYATHILKLKALDALDEDPAGADFGSLIHRALDRYVKAHATIAPDAWLDTLLDYGREEFGDWLERPSIAAFWWPRFERIAAWFVEADAARRQAGAEVLSELNGEYRFAAPAGDFLLIARADRIERKADGTAAIIDYKTGTMPTGKAVEQGLSSQLPLEALILGNGGFPGVPASATGELSYWQVKGGDPAGEENPLKLDIPGALEAARTGLEALIAAFDDPTTPYLANPDPARESSYNDYAHLERLKEWGS
ncbi:MAG: double-strand break repair protein AddB [Alphaproteobacteria bacterium]|nr:double-strand break repair protein AddB [Alphaproteobacteria bacterium]